MEINPLSTGGAFVCEPVVHSDLRGSFAEWFRADLFFQATGRDLDLRQGNISVSKKGVVRGIHFADVPPGQAKYVTCPYGSIIDFIVDIRVGSSTFGQWEAVEVNSKLRNAVFLSEGLGHAFVSLQDETVVSYLVTDTFKPDREHGINPLDPDLNIDFGLPTEQLLFSEKDKKAPTLKDALNMGLLPKWLG
ncbi:dTDP-4-dehydrorhamnose 3,5-epimerase family protein [Aurantimicrobium minutum]|uniref:dTDP-4-dehydrorhamnose 3,5-epimerase family protein n=1 Tax=Aurantimicrobium minutum TaxID=708131 RepID=UPI0024746055|nr:dTDP-4-dehydrorhamnose 3,5-epimerase [Aurantimicrobium minutum]MDH6239006.1 dTDP-4-dehydrorhamnose 3,5-epimerase [Aurantimicrobium minutum]